jgi:hypothetical protein
MPGFGIITITNSVRGIIIANAGTAIYADAIKM